MIGRGALNWKMSDPEVRDRTDRTPTDSGIAEAQRGRFKADSDLVRSEPSNRPQLHGEEPSDSKTQQLAKECFLDPVCMYTRVLSRMLKL